MNIRILILTVIVQLPVINNCFSQVGFSVTKRFFSQVDSSHFAVLEPIRGFYFPVIVDDDYFELIKEKDFLKLFNNGQLLDTLKENEYKVNLNSIQNVYFDRGNFYLIAFRRIVNPTQNDFKYGVYDYSIRNRKFELVLHSAPFIYGLYGDSFYSIKGDASIISFSKISLRSKVVLDIKDKICKDCVIGGVYSFKNTDYLLIYSGKPNGDHLESDQFFVYNTLDKRLQEVTEKFNLICVQKLNEWTEYDYYIDMSFSRALPRLIKVRRPDCIEHTESFLVDENVNIQLNLLERVSTAKGLIYKNNDVVGYFLTSRGDNRKDVLITDTPSLILETIFSKIFNDIIILESDLIQLSNYHIDLLEKFIYAKHNLKFDEEYYQYYFNTFSFYADPVMRKSRKPEVKDLLTEADFKNLLLLSKY